MAAPDKYSELSELLVESLNGTISEEQFRRMEEMLEFFTLQREILEEISKPEFMATIIGGMKKE